MDQAGHIKGNRVIKGDKWWQVDRENFHPSEYIFALHEIKVAENINFWNTAGAFGSRCGFSVLTMSVLI